MRRSEVAPFLRAARLARRSPPRGSHVCPEAGDEFRTVDFERVRRLMSGSGVVDARNALDGRRLVGLGFSYDGVGLPAGSREGAPRHA